MKKFLCDTERQQEKRGDEKEWNEHSSLYFWQKKRNDNSVLVTRRRSWSIASPQSETVKWKKYKIPPPLMSTLLLKYKKERKQQKPRQRQKEHWTLRTEKKPKQPRIHSLCMKVIPTVMFWIFYHVFMLLPTSSSSSASTGSMRYHHQGECTQLWKNEQVRHEQMNHWRKLNFPFFSFFFHLVLNEKLGWKFPRTLSLYSTIVPLFWLISHLCCARAIAALIKTVSLSGRRNETKLTTWTWTLTQRVEHNSEFFFRLRHIVCE